MFAALLGGLGSSFLRGAILGYGSASSAFRSGNLAAPDFNNLYGRLMNNGGVSVEIRDLKHLESQLREVAPDLAKDYRKNLTKIGRPAVNEMRKTFRKIDKRGPLWNKRGNRPGRTYDSMYSSYVSNISWYQTQFASGRKGIDVNYKNRKASSDMAKLTGGADGTLGIVRIAVKSPAYIMADISGRGNRRKGDGQLSRQYRIHLFGEGQYITRRHKVRAENVSKWISALNSGQGQISSKPSRYAYPTMEKYSPKFAASVTKVLNTTISELNKRLAS